MQASTAQTEKKVLIITAEQFEDSELLQPYRQLQEKGINSDIASIRNGAITGKHGTAVTADITVDEVDPNNYDLLLLPGGKAPAELRKHRAVLDIARCFFQQDKPVAAICHGPQILISAGVMQGRTATAYPSVGAELEEAGAHYRDQELVVDGNLITSRRPADLPAFIRQILTVLHGDEVQNKRPFIPY
jgi:protease I